VRNIRKTLSCWIVIGLCGVIAPTARTSAASNIVKTDLGARVTSSVATPNGLYAYVALTDLGVVRKIRLSDQTTIASISLPSVRHMAMSPDGSVIIAVTGLIGEGLTRISTSTDSIVATISPNGWARLAEESVGYVDGGLNGIMFTSDSSYVWVRYRNLSGQGWTSSYVARIRLADNAADKYVQIVRSSEGSISTSLSLDENYVYVGNVYPRRIDKYSLSDGLLMWTTAIYTYPYRFLEMVDGNLFVASAVDNSDVSQYRLSRFNASSGNLLDHLVLGSYEIPNTMLVSENNKVISVLTNAPVRVEGVGYTSWKLRRFYLSNLTETSEIIVVNTTNEYADGSVLDRRLVITTGDSLAVFDPELRSQTITFTAIDSRLVGSASFSVSPTSDSALPVSVSSTTSSVCTVTGSTVSIVGAGRCTIRALIAAGSGWAASQLDRSFDVLSDTPTASITRTLTFAGSAASGPVLTGTDVFLNAGASTTVSGTFSKFEWDLDGDGTYEIDSGMINTRTLKFTEIGSKTVGVRVTSLGGISGTAMMSIEVRKAPPEGEPGVSILDGASFTNTKSIKVGLVWPANATEARISNDGGFAASKTKTFPLASSVDWELDDSVKGLYTKVIYVRFNGSGIDTTKTYSDDIILDTTPPVVESSSASEVSGSIDVTLKATDDITGVDKVQVKNGTTTVTKDYKTKVTVTEKELELTVSAASVRKSDSSSIEVRVSDKAGNWSSYQTLAIYRAGSNTVTTPTVNTPTVTTPTVNTPTVTTPTVNTPTVTTPTVVVPKVTTSKPATAKSIATFAKLKVLSTSKVSLRIVASSAKYCRVSGASLKGLKAGTCKVTVTVTPKKGRATSKTVTLKVTK
jgi:hypothetical protein